MLVFGTLCAPGTSGWKGPVGGQAGDGQGALRGAVVHRTAREMTLYLVCLPCSLKYCFGELPGGIPTHIAATGGEEDLVQVARRVVRETLGELDGLGVRVRPHGEERELLGLLVRDLGQFLAAVLRR
ncbi:hypothetical protein STANM309S_01097 [Streptomyces tanashiensis]